MSRVQLSINVSDFGAAAFFSRLTGAGLTKLRPGYANFATDVPPHKLVLNAPGNRAPAARPATRPSESPPPARWTRPESARPPMAWPPAPGPGIECCYARQDKVWVHDPNGVP